MLLILALYLTIVIGSLTRVWGVDYRLDFQHYAVAITRGIEAFMDTTFLSAVATPIAGVAGMVIAYLVVRKAFRGREALDFLSNLGGAVPGTILGIGYILAFIKAPLLVVGIIYALLAGYLAAAGTLRVGSQVGLVILGSVLGHGLVVTAPMYAAALETRVVVWGAAAGHGTLACWGRCQEPDEACWGPARYGPLPGRLLADTTPHHASGHMGTWVVRHTAA